MKGIRSVLKKIKESFRVMKNTIEVRPVYHWTERRIKGHLEDALDKKVSSEKIKEALRSITLTEFSIEGKKYYLRNKMDKSSKGII